MPKGIAPLIVGNWKMHGTRSSLAEVRALIGMIGNAGRALPEVAVCPPTTLLAAVSETVKGSAVRTGAQDCHSEQQGAFTGDISAAMIADAGGTLVIVGHSERRTGHGETSALVRRKAEQAFLAGLTPIVCVGESSAERSRGETLAVVEKEISDSLPPLAEDRMLVVAYEPLWAIGTGVTPTTDEIEQIHAAIRRLLVKRFGERGAMIPILYGGSVKPGNAGSLLALAEVNGALVGGASLLARDFYGIISSATI